MEWCERYPDVIDVRARACAVCPRNFEGSSAKASLELKYDGGLGTAHGRLRLVHVGTTASDRSMSIAKPGGKTAWAAAIWRRMLSARVVWPAMLIQRTTSGAAGAEIRGKSAAEQAAADIGRGGPTMVRYRARVARGRSLLSRRSPAERLLRG